MQFHQNLRGKKANDIIFSNQCTTSNPLPTLPPRHTHTHLGVVVVEEVEVDSVGPDGSERRPKLQSVQVPAYLSQRQSPGRHHLQVASGHLQHQPGAAGDDGHHARAVLHPAELEVH